MPKGRENGGEASTEAYARASAPSSDDVCSSDDVKKYGDIRPDLSVYEPNDRAEALSSRGSSVVLYDVEDAMVGM